MKFKITDKKGNKYIAEEVVDASKVKDSKLLDKDEEEKEEDFDLGEDLDEKETDKETETEKEDKDEESEESVELTEDDIKNLKELAKKLPDLLKLLDEKEGKEAADEDEDEDEIDEEEFLDENGEVIDLDKKQNADEDDDEDILTDDCDDTFVKDSKSSFGSVERQSGNQIQSEDERQQEIFDAWVKRMKNN